VSRAPAFRKENSTGRLTAKTILLPGEDEAFYRTMCEGMFATFAPESEPEIKLVQLLCDTQWRIERCGRIEAAILSADVSRKHPRRRTACSRSARKVLSFKRAA
jgi:hypothetical protein